MTSTNTHEEATHDLVSALVKSLESADTASEVPEDQPTVDVPPSNSETEKSSDPPAPTEEAPPVIPTSAAAPDAATAIPAVASPAAAVPAPTPPPHIPTSTSTYAPESSTPAKRSRTPELGEEAGAEKRQKIEHPVSQDSIQDHGDVKVEDDGDLNGDDSSDWNLESMLANALGAVNETDDSMNLDTTTTAPPARRRLEKMKFIESPTYFSRSMGLPILGSLVSGRLLITRFFWLLIHMTGCTNITCAFPAALGGHRQDHPRFED